MTQSSASRRAHTIEHACGTHHRPQRRPAQRPNPRPSNITTTSNTRKASPTDTNHGHEQATRRPNPRPTSTPTSSNTLKASSIDTDHDNTQATRQQPHNQPQHSGERHSGEAGRVTPGRGREQDTRQPNPRPAGTPTASNTIEAHTINNGNGQHNDPDLGQQLRPPNRTRMWHTPSTPTTPIPSTTTNHPTTSPDTVAWNTPAKPVG